MEETTEYLNLFNIYKFKLFKNRNTVEKFFNGFQNS